MDWRLSILLARILLGTSCGNVHKHLEQVVPHLEDLRIVSQVCKLCLQFFVNYLRANELMIACPTLCDQLIRDHPRLK